MVRSAKMSRRKMSVSQYLKRALPAIYITILFVNSLVTTARAQLAYPTFSISNSDSVLQNLFLSSDNNDELYIGALNNIYKLDASLNLLRTMSTGPVNDSVECRPPPSDCESNRVLTDNYNKLILLHENRLVTCGSIYQGTCQLRDKDTLDVTYGSSLRTVVPNTPDGSAVGFIDESDGEEPVLYVASANGDWLANEPVTVSTRQIFQISQDSNLIDLFEPISRIVIPQGTFDNSPSDRQFNIGYIYGFTSGQFSYFVASQPSEHLSISKYTSKVVRLCHGDPDFHSYIELPLVCANSALDEYNLVQSAHLASLSLNGAASEKVLVATFSKSESETSGTPTSKSAICIYPIEDINQAFWNRRLACARADTGNTEINWAGSSACLNNVLLFKRIMDSSPDEYCHRLDVQSPLGGDNRDITISASPVYESPSYITAIAAVQHFETSIIFTGDSDGVLKKLRLDDDTSAMEYESLSLHQSPVIQNGFLLSSDKNYIYVTSEDQITKLPIEECEDFTTCESCHGAMDPYCGWCSLEAKCTRRVDAECTGSQDGTSLRWLSTNDDCLAISSVTPEFAPAETETELVLDVTNLPPIPSEGGLRCLFSEDGAELGSVLAAVSGSGVTCRTPGNIQGTEAGFRTVDLQLYYEEDGESRTITSEEPFDFYDCRKFQSCSSCTGNPYGCKWDLNDNQCNDGDSIDGLISDQNMCPLVLSLPEVIIPDGGVKQFAFTVENIPSTSRTFRCEISFPANTPQKITVDAVVNRNSISCAFPSFTYPGSEESVSGSLQVYWGDFPLSMDNPQIVTIYKCEQKAVTVLDGEGMQTCGMCLSIDINYGCGWCPVNNGCLSPITSDGCPADSYLRKGMGCPNPNIVSISPVIGHVDGGTLITITGYNLGLGESDIRSISVAGVQCTSFEFVTSQLLRCTTVQVQGGRSGPINVQFNDTSATSMDDFTYLQPRFQLLYPNVGPQSGGTPLVIRGQHLDAGVKRSVIISSTNPCVESGTSYPCEIIKNNNEEIICKTSAGNITGSVTVNFDDGCEYREENSFEYRPDPVVEKFENLMSIESGGIHLVITGTSFNIIQDASMEFRVGQDVLTGLCSNTSDSTELTCVSPRIPDSMLPLSIPVGNISLYMDGVTAYRQLTEVFPGTNQGFFEYIVDPVYDPLPIPLQIPHDMQLDIDILGDNLINASSTRDVKVFVGGKSCMVSLLTLKLLRCKSPEHTPGKHSVKVMHGFREYRVGEVQYLPEEFSMVLLGAIIAGGVLVILVIIIIIVLYYCCLNFSNNEKQFRELEEQRDAMEMVVAQECKEAFAELQTGVLSITNDVEGTGIPMWDYKSYAMWALFPHQTNHPVLRELAVPPAQRENVRKGLNRFGLLLANKSFLVHFVEVLEKQNTIAVEDMTNIASLLMVCFQGRMDYATEVMKTLLKKAIKEHVREGQEAVLMRRGGHIVEKVVSHWLSFLMYPYLEEVAGEPLFSLFYALHRQISSGPVDEVTTMARYGLNEGALIRQKIEHNVLCLHVKGIDNNLDSTKAEVLDCDTISQVKEKILEVIYKTAHYSNRPHKEETDLEWSDSPEGKVILIDYNGIKTSDGWRQLNTLKTYGVPDGATVVLLPAQNGNTSMSSSSSSPSRSVIYASMSPTTSMTPIITLEKEQGAQFMHLMKQTSHGTSKKTDSNKVIAEIYLTRLLTTKGILQPFVDEMFATIMTVEEDGTNLPLPIKYLFDFLDEQAAECNITNANIIHQWKTNCLQLRFWVNLIKNPNFVFDINKTHAVDNCLSVIGQCLMDSCSTSQQTLTKDSPSSRLLYAKEIPRYREMVLGYYKGINAMPPVSDQDMNTMLADFSSQHKNTFHTLTALNELYFCYAFKCRDEILQTLQSDETTQKYRLVEKFHEVERLLAG